MTDFSSLITNLVKTLKSEVSKMYLETFFEDTRSQDPYYEGETRQVVYYKSIYVEMKVYHAVDNT